MADKKITALPAAGAVATTDLIPIAHDPAGVPATQKATVAAVVAAVVGATPAGGFAGVTAMNVNDAATLAAAEAYTDALAGPVKLFSLPRLAELSGVVASAGNYTAGRKFWVVNQAVTCTGVRFWHSSGAPRDFKVTLVDIDGTTIIEQKTVLAAPDASTIVVTWDAAHVLAPSATGFYRVMVYELSGAIYIHYPPPTFAHTQADAMPWFASGTKQVWMGRSGYRAGDSPVGALSGNYYVFGDGGDFYGVEPIVS